MKKNSKRLLVLALVLVLFGGEADSRAEDAAAVATETLQLEELWRLDDTSEEPVLGLVSQVTADDGGTVYLLDSRLHQVHVIGPDGEYRESLSREGDGPGEVRDPRGLLFMPDGTLGLLQRLPGRLVTIALDGTPAGTITFANAADGGFTSFQKIRRSGAHFVVLGRNSLRESTATVWEYFLARVSTDGVVDAPFISARARMDFAHPAFAERDHYLRQLMAWCVGPRGEVYAVPERERYHIEVYGADGTPGRSIDRDFAPPERDEHHRRALQAVYESCTRGAPVDVACTVEKHQPAILGLHVDAAGSLWVRHARSASGTAEGDRTTFDVFGPEGRLQRRVAVDGLYVGEADEIFLPRPGLLIVVRNVRFDRLALDCQGGAVIVSGDGSGAEPPAVACYRIVP